MTILELFTSRDPPQAAIIIEAESFPVVEAGQPIPTVELDANADDTAGN
jgi:hypothetical protein